MKIDKSKLFKTAWKIAKKSAAEWNRPHLPHMPARDFFDAALKQAWLEITHKIDALRISELGDYRKLTHFHHMCAADFNRVFGAPICNVGRENPLFYVSPASIAEIKEFFPAKNLIDFLEQGAKCHISEQPGGFWLVDFKPLPPKIGTAPNPKLREILDWTEYPRVNS